MEMSSSLAITAALLLTTTHHLLLTTSVAEHTTPNATSSPQSITFGLVASNACSRHTDGFLHLQHNLSHAVPPSSNNDTNTLEGLKMPRPVSLVMEFGTGPGRETYTLKVQSSGYPLPWIQCKGCDPMSPQPRPLFDPAASPTFRYFTGEPHICNPPYGDPVTTRDGRSMCAFEIVGRAARGARMLVKGFVSDDHMALPGQAPQHLLGFGCAQESHNFDSYGVYAGAVTMGAAQGSLVTQLASLGLTRFSYCLSIAGSGSESRQGFLRFFGPAAGAQQLGPRFKTTKILPPHHDSEYHLGLVGVSLGTRRLHTIRPEMFARRDGDEEGGCVIDLGTWLTVMVHPAYQVIEDAVWSDLQRHGPAERVTHAGFGLCFRATQAVKSNLQPLSLHFAEDDAVMVFSPEQLFLMMHDQRGQIACLAMEPGRQTVIGAFHQVDKRFVYDVKENRLSFASESCIEDTTTAQVVD